MNKSLRKIISFLLLLALLVSGYPNVGNIQTTQTAEAASQRVFGPADHTYDSTSSHYEYKFSETNGSPYFNQIEYDKNKGTFPKRGGYPYPLQISLGGTKYTLNYNIWRQKNLYVYGSPTSIPASDNYFKCGYQIQNLNQFEPYLYYTNGYFSFPKGKTCMGITQNGEHPDDGCASRGEWKYLGYDVNGNYFSNMWMINVATKTTFNQRKWQANPWNSDLVPYTKLSKGMSDYNKTAYGLGIQDTKAIQGTRTWIYSTFNDMIRFNGIPTGSGKDPNVYKYLYVQSPPTTKMAGSGKMWHKVGNINDPPSEENIWYQTFSIPKLIHKENLPVETSITGTTIAKIPNDTAGDNAEQTVYLNVSATLKDDAFYQDASAKTAYYTRYDLKKWKFVIEVPSLGISIANGNQLLINPSANGTNKISTRTSTKVKLSVLRGIKSDANGVRTITATVHTVPIYTDDKLGNNADASGTIKMNTAPDPEPVQPAPPLKVEVPQIIINNHIGEIAFDGVPFDDVSDGTDLSAVSSTEVYVNDTQVDYSTFFSGSYIFPTVDNVNEYFAMVTVKYTLDKSKILMENLTPAQEDAVMSATTLEYISTDWVYVYPTKPYAHFNLTSNSWKQNRIIDVTNDSPASNIQLVINKFPIVQYEWSYGGDTTKLFKGTDTDLQKQLQYSEPGSYSLTLRCMNTLGKWSAPCTVEYQVLEDYAPNIEVNLQDAVVTRTDDVTAWHYDLNSTDGDKVANAAIELWYDSDNDGITETKLGTWNGLGDNGICELTDFPTYTHTKLGFYKFKIYAKDEFVGVSGQDTLTQYITDASKKSNTYETEFWVDNYRPLSDIYLETAIDRPDVDLFIMRNKNLPDAKMKYLSDNRVAMENDLLGNNIIPSISIWDMKTYTYSTPASTSVYTGSAYPDATIPYSSNGYSGTLPRTSVSSSSGSYDAGSYQNQQESKTATNYKYGTTKVTYTWNGSDWIYTSVDATNNSYPTAMSYGPDGSGYSGTLTKTGGYITSSSDPQPSSPTKGQTYVKTEYWEVPYTGTVYRTVPVWVPNIVYYTNYTGYYSGTIYKDVREPYTNPWRASSTKYILYLSDTNMAEPADFNYAKSQCDAKLILAGTSAITSQSGYDKYIDVTGKTVDVVMGEVLDYISQQTPNIEQFYVQPNQTFTLKYGEQDLDGDSIISREMQYVQDKNYFDNPTGQESGTQTPYSDTSGWTTTIKSSFANVGKYRIFRRVKDSPAGAYGSTYSYYSGSTEVDIYVHRKPIALAKLDWDFDAGTNTYKTNWVDQSYDLDHNVTRSATDRGISERKIMWRRDSGEWNYTIPNNLSPGTYTLRYYVKDIENAWSDLFTISIDGTTYSNVPEVIFTLATSPPMQFEAKLRTESLQFRTPASPVTLPASENLQIYDIWTRYPSNPSLTMALFNQINTQVCSTKTVYFTSSLTGTKTGNDINWYNISYNAKSTLADGNYIFKISANGTQSKTISFPVVIFTPINLSANINGKSSDAQINTGDINLFTFTTSKYVNSTSLVFEGKTYTSSAGQIRLVSNTGSTKMWSYADSIPDGAYPDGRTGIAEFRAYLPTGKSETATVNYKIVGIKANNFAITMMLDIGWRSYYFNIGQGIDDNHDGQIDRYPRQAITDIGTLKLPVNYYSLVGFSRMYIKAGYKVKGKIDIQGTPDSAKFKISYIKDKVKYYDYVNLIKGSNNTYLFEWIIPLETDSNTFINFDLITVKSASIYGNEKWIDTWDSRNTDRKVFYVKGNAYEDITFVQSQ